MGLGLIILGALGVLGGLALVSAGTYCTEKDLEEKRKGEKGRAIALLISGIIVTLIAAIVLTYQGFTGTASAGALGELV